MIDRAEHSHLKQCCAGFYGSELAHLLLGESFHPGGTALTERLGHLLELHRDSKVLDVAAGRGASALYLAEKFGCEVVGLDLSPSNVAVASQDAAARGLTPRVTFRIADAERMPFDDAAFDAVLCECAFCTFPEKRGAAAEFSRVLKPGGRLGLSDLTRTTGPLAGLDDLLSWIACIGDAQPVERYREILQEANFAILDSENQSGVLVETVRQIQGRLLAVEITAALQKLASPRIDLAQAKHFIQAAMAAINRGQLGYVLLTAARP